MKTYQMCKRCIMDNASDDTIVFDENGYCNYCNNAIKLKNDVYFPNEYGSRKLDRLLSELKMHGKNKKYDCLMGISGGLDSSYLAYLGAVKWNLRILAIHIDDGFDTFLANKNIENLCNKCNVELKVIRPNKEQFNDLTRAFILAEVPNIAIPQDNILFANIYDYMRKYKVNYFLSGSNFALESILQKGNTYSAFDLVHIKDVNKKFGAKSINKLSFMSFVRKSIDIYIKGIKTITPLNYIKYNKEEAIQELENFCGFQYYKAKHLENTLTKVVQLYWFYHKFGVDKRRSHLSSLIIDGQITREDALSCIAEPVYNEDEMDHDINYILDALNMKRDLFDELVARPGHDHSYYKTDKLYFNLYRPLFLSLKKNLSCFIKELSNLN